MKPRVFRFKEHQGFYCRRSADDRPSDAGLFPLDASVFEKLVTFVERSFGGEKESFEVMSIFRCPGYGRVVKAKNFVGVIRFADGMQIEILPKIEGATETETKSIFLKMLRLVLHLRNRVSGLSNLSAEHMPLFDVFIRLFLDEVLLLVKQGLSGAYGRIQGNERFYKGKLSLARHIRENCVHQERFFVEYDIFSSNSPENRIIQSALRFLGQIAEEDRNRRDIRMLSQQLECIPFSSDLDGDFSAVRGKRLNERYRLLMDWCGIFLRKRGFTTFTGECNAVALLFPMEKLFESYIAICFERFAREEGWTVSVQGGRKWLFDRDDDGYKPAFQLKPDLILRRDGVTIIADTKWKRLSKDESDNFGISQSDMYQMYAYSARFSAKETCLIYPWAGFDVTKRFGEIGGADVRVYSFRLNDDPSSQVRDVCGR